MANVASTSSAPQDVHSWIKWIIEYVSDAQAKHLDFRTLRDYGLILEDSNVEPVFDALVGSEITSVHFGNRPLTHKMHCLSKKLTKTNIVTLNLTACNLSVDDVLSLIAVLNNTQVTELDISRNGARLENKEILRFATLLAKSHLKSLNLSGNSIIPFEKTSVLFRKLPDTQITCLNLSSFLFASGYGFHKNRRKILNALIKKLQYTAVTDLNLEWNELGNPVAKAISAVLENTKLEKLHLSHNQITDFGVDLLVPPLTRSKITYLDLSSNLIDGNNCLGNCLKDTKVTELNLSNNQLTNEKIFSRPNFLQGSVVSSLKFSYCKYRNSVFPLPIRDLRFSELTYLDVSSNMLDLEQVSGLGDVISNSKLTHLDLSGNELSEECYAILSECSTKSILKYINLSQTARAIESIRGIASFLDKTKGLSIVSIDLRCNNLGSGVDIIAPVLANTTFIELDLSFNNFKNSVDSIAEQLKSTAITALSLNGNYIGDNSVTVLARCLEDTKIIMLDLRNNAITNIGATALALSLKSTKLRHLHLEHNEIEDDGLESLAEHAENSCIVDIRAEICPWNKVQMIGRIVWQNFKRLRQFSDLLKQTAFFTGDSDIFEFDRELDGVNIDVFIEDFLKLYKMFFEEQYLVNAIEQEKLILDLKNQEFLTVEQGFSGIEYRTCIEDCEFVYKKIVEHPSPVQDTMEHSSASFFNKHILWLLLDKFPRQFVDFIGKRIEADVTQHVYFLRKVDALGLTGVVELLLLSRPKYVIDENQDILHPYVYQMLHKYKQPICNVDIEPKGMEKIVGYFKKHIDLDGASEVVSLLTGRK